jgi:predicted permease
VSQLWLIGLCLGLGFATARLARPPPGLAHSLNWWILNIALPATVLELVPQIRFEWSLWFLIASMWFVLLGAWLLFSTVGRSLGWSRARTGALILVCGLGNTSFVGYPLIEALRGREGLALGVVADQAGCFPALAVGGITIAALYSGNRPQPHEIARRVLLFPAFLALCASIVIGRFGGWPDIANEMLHRIASTLTPLALFSVGLQFRLHLGRSQLGALVLGLGWKLVLAPFLVYASGIAAGIGGPTLVIGTLQAAMAPMISAAILADQFNLEPPLANTVLGAGIILSLLTVPFANGLL